MDQPILFVSLGPGEPELITLKGLKALQTADYIFCPSTLSPSGKVISRSVNILRELEIPSEKIRRFQLPMSKNRARAFQAYDEVYEASKLFFEKGRKVVIVAEGDAGFYSSIHYILDKLKKNNIPVEQIAGIPAFIAAGALGRLQVVQQEERIIVIPGIVTTNELSTYLEQKMVVVIMKLSQCTETVHQVIKQYPGYAYHYFENVGTEKEYYSCSPDELSKMKYPYFSLMIIKHVS